MDFLNVDLTRTSATSEIIEKSLKKSTYFRVTVRMNNGSVRTITQKTDPGFKTGDSVKIENGTLVRG